MPNAPDGQGGDGVEPRAVVEAERRPAPRRLPPVANPPRVVALAGAVELDALVAHQDLAVHPTGDLVAVDSRGPAEGDAVGLPLQVEAESGALPPQPVVGVRRVVQGHAERLEPQAQVVEGRLDVVVGPQSVVAHLQRGVARGEGDGLIDHGHQRAPRPHHAGPVPDDPEVRVATDAHVAAQAGVVAHEVHVVRLVPQRLGAGGMGVLVGGVRRPEGQFRGGDRGIGHGRACQESGVEA